MLFYTLSECPRSPHFNCANDKSVSRSIPDIREELEQAFVVSELQKTRVHTFHSTTFGHSVIYSATRKLQYSYARLIQGALFVSLLPRSVGRTGRQ